MSTMMSLSDLDEERRKSRTDMAEDTLILQSHASSRSVKELVRWYSQNSVTPTCAEKTAVLDTDMTECCDGYSDHCSVLRYPAMSDSRTAISQIDADTDELLAQSTVTDDSLALRDQETLCGGLDADDEVVYSSVQCGRLNTATSCSSAHTSDRGLVLRTQETSCAEDNSSMYSFETGNSIDTTNITTVSSQYLHTSLFGAMMTVSRAMETTSRVDADTGDSDDVNASTATDDSLVLRDQESLCGRLNTATSCSSAH